MKTEQKSYFFNKISSRMFSSSYVRQKQIITKQNPRFILRRTINYMSSRNPQVKSTNNRGSQNNSNNYFLSAELTPGNLSFQHTKFNFLFSSYLYNSYRGVNVYRNCLWSTYKSMDKVGGPPQNYGQQNTRNSTEDNTELNMEKENRNTETLIPYIP